MPVAAASLPSMDGPSLVADAAPARIDLGRELHVHQDRAARPLAGDGRLRRGSRSRRSCSAAWSRRARRASGRLGGRAGTAGAARAVQVAGPFLLIAAGRAGDLLLARRDPRHLGADLHRRARDLVRPRGALAGTAAGRRRARLRRGRGAARRGPQRLGLRSCSAASRWCSPASATRSAASSSSIASPTSPPIGVAAWVMVASTALLAPAALGDAVRGPRPASARWPRSPCWACSAPGSRSRSSTT